MTNAPTPTAAHTATHRFPPWAPVAAIITWFALWYFVPGLHSIGLASILSVDDATGVVIESILALAIIGALLLAFRRTTRELFARDRTVWLWAVPVILAIALPFHYGLEYPVGIYIFWMAASVFYQDVLTFGLLQSVLRDRLPIWATISLVAVVFALGHVLWLPERFGLANPIGALAMLALGAVLATLRTWPRTMHLVLVLHLSFYYAFA